MIFNTESDRTAQRELRRLLCIDSLQQAWYYNTDHKR